MGNLSNYNLNLNEIQDSQSFEPIPEGSYNLQVKEAEVKPTKKGGAYIRLSLEVCDGKFARRRIFHNLNVFCPTNTQAEDIAKSQLKALGESNGITGVITDTDQLIGAKVVAKVTIATQEGYDPQNEVKSMKAIKGVVPNFSQPQAQQSYSFSQSQAQPQPQNDPFAGF